MFNNILLAVDGSEQATHAARVAGELARSLAADLTIVTVFDPVPNYLGETNLQSFVTDQRIRSERVLHEALNEVGEVTAKLITEILEGPVAEAVLKVAEVRSNDLIIMGTRGLSRLAGALLGSQSQKVISNANCPVLLVK
ncbi:MAG TPA: universal stress protein [Anaerolineaceae bacterium]|nr:universal stress protein [Anaerolineaceae bacterium]HBA92257.1 universal stress protein [Anaerolineaceae bacterium]